ncbi:MAG: hypothetical protein ABGY11_04530 [Candidatus Thioglobus sp.]
MRAQHITTVSIPDGITVGDKFALSDNKSAALNHNARQNNISLYHRSGHLLKTITNIDPEKEFFFSKDEQLIYFKRHDIMRAYVERGEIKTEAIAKDVSISAVSKCGNIIAYVNDRHVKVLDITQGTTKTIDNLGSHALALAFNADKSLAISKADKSVTIYNSDLEFVSAFVCASVMPDAMIFTPNKLVCSTIGAYELWHKSSASASWDMQFSHSKNSSKVLSEGNGILLSQDDCALATTDISKPGWNIRPLPNSSNKNLLTNGSGRFFTACAGDNKIQVYSKKRRIVAEAPEVQMVADSHVSLDGKKVKAISMHKCSLFALSTYPGDRLLELEEFKAPQIAASL